MGIVTDLSGSFYPYPKDRGKNGINSNKGSKRTTESVKKPDESIAKVSPKMRQRSKKLAKIEKNRTSILTTDLKHCYFCGAKKQDLHELLGGRNRLLSMKYGLVVPVCRLCHTKIENDESIKLELHKKAQKVFQERYKDVEFIKEFGKNYL